MVAPASQDGAPLYKNPKAKAEARAEDLLKRLTFDEKCELVGGIDSMFIKPIPRLGIPSIKMSDGPLGVRCYGKTTAYPGGVNSAASWDPELARRVGIALGRDCRARGVHILLGPGVNIYRDARNGRNFEYGGEDPFLAGATVAAICQGIQSQGVLATIKHYACNNQETDRGDGNSTLDERTFREIYLPAFKAAIVDGKSWCVMDAYNKINGPWCTANDFLNTQILRKEWGFKGIVMSDWGAVHDTVSVANGGLDLEMPSGQFLNPKSLKKAIDEGKVKQATIDEKVRRILYTCIANGFYDRSQELNYPKDDPTSAKAALDASRGGLVLLKNKGNLLPLNPAKFKTIAVVGPNSHPAVWGGGGSSWTDPFHSQSVADGVKAIVGASNVKVVGGNSDIRALVANTVFTSPIKLELFKNKDLSGEPAKTLTVNKIAINRGAGEDFEGVGSTGWSARYTTKILATRGGKYMFGTNSDDGVRVYVNGKLVLDDWSDHGVQTKTASIELDEMQTYDLKVEFYQNLGDSVLEFGYGQNYDAVKEAVNAAKNADAAIVCVGFNSNLEGEGWDRTYALPGGQVELIQAVRDVNPNTIVVLTAGGGTDWDGWLDQTPALIHAWYPGQEGGQAIAEVIFGKVNPSGKLPMSFEKKPSDNPSYPNFLNPEDTKKKIARYGEGIFVGYRGYDKKGVEPQFAFGFGLSYTTFGYSGLKVTGGSKVQVTFTLKNTGKVAGAEVAQVYVSQEKCSVERPVKELKGFTKVMLKPGESKTVTVTLNRDAFSFWHPTKKAWIVEPGKFKVLVGASSRDIKLTGSVNYK